MINFYADFGAVFRQSGVVCINVDGFNFTIDLSFPHERAYAAKLLCDIRHPQCDIDELLIRRVVRAGDRVLDAGAHIGFTTRQMFLAGASEVVAVEPVPSICERLRSLQRSGLSVVNSAISAEAGSGTLIVSTAHNQGSSLEPLMMDIFPSVFTGEPSLLTVEVTTIDTLVQRFGVMDVWKLDIEGAETPALIGAMGTLETAPPRAIIAELYDRFRDDFVNRVNRSHPYAYRAFIRRDSYELVLTPYDAPWVSEFHETSPMYLFSAEPI